MGSERLICGLDIGTTKVCAMICQIGPDGEEKIIGVGTAPSDGLRRGVVVNLDKTIASIERAISGAEQMAGTEITSVYAGIAGDHIKSINSRGVIAVSRADNEISEYDVERVIAAAKAVAIPSDREVIHILPQEFIVDDQGGIKDPIGMSGVRLEAEVHIVTGAITSAQNIYKSIRRAGYEVCDLVLEPLASALCVLTADEEELGTVLVDLGGGTTDVALFTDSSVRYTSVIGLGGRNITNDIAIGLRTPVDHAERIKLDFGAAMSGLVNPEEMISVPTVGDRPPREVSRAVLATIIEPRAEEIFRLVFKELKRTNFYQAVAGGVVLTGGGSLLNGIDLLAERIFDMPVRVGTPSGFTGMSMIVTNPIYATAFGLLRYGIDHPEKAAGEPGVFNRAFTRLEKVFNSLFNL
ncbi:MAG: cell division protein FtsA [candidate division Zixibacteria bacterium]|nr:cell division protein FtsA [candidate division Zixibacteria bacterium]